MPADTPETTPLDASIVALFVEALLQTPPPVALVRVVVPFSHRVSGPPIAATVGSGFTVIVAVELGAVVQPLLVTNAL